MGGVRSQGNKCLPWPWQSHSQTWSPRRAQGKRPCKPAPQGFGYTDFHKTCLPCHVNEVIKIKINSRISQHSCKTKPAFFTFWVKPSLSRVKLQKLHWSEWLQTWSICVLELCLSQCSSRLSEKCPESLRGRSGDHLCALFPSGLAHQRYKMDIGKNL